MISLGRGRNRVQRWVFSQFQSGGGQTRHDCRDRNVQNFGDFAVGKTLDISQINRLALSFRQGIDTANDLRSHDVWFRGKGIVSLCAIPGGFLTHPACAYFVDPDRMQQAQQPSFHTRACYVLTRALKCAHASPVHQILGHMPIARQQQTVAPQSRQMLSEFCSEGLLANGGFPYQCSGCDESWTALVCKAHFCDLLSQT